MAKRDEPLKDWCPICGVEFRQGGYAGHKCKQKTLDGIDAALKRDPDDILERRQPEGKRLADGFFMLGLTDRQD